MKVLLSCLLVGLCAVSAWGAGPVREKFTLDGAKGKLSAILVRPETSAEKTPVVVLCHGFRASKDEHWGMLKAIADELATAGIASVRFDFNGHGESEGLFTDMTVPNEIADAKQVVAWVRRQPWAGKVSLLGHSQGGVVASMTAGELGHAVIDRVMLLAPACVLKDAAKDGWGRGPSFDPEHPPKTLKIWGSVEIGGEYVKTAYKLPIYETARKFTGPVLLLHGTGDFIAIAAASERFHREYVQSELHLLKDDDHGLSKHFPEVLKLIRAFCTADRTTVLNDGWSFRKEGEADWRAVTVPHDWAIEETPKKGLCPGQGNLPFTGKGYYKRALDGFVPPPGGKVYLDFDGVMCRSEIFLNGKKIGGTPFGYTSECIDVTDALKAQDNLLEVTAENVPWSSRWYSGSGIFRDVTVRVVPRDHVKPRTLFIRTVKADETAAEMSVSFEWTGGVSNFTFTVEKPRLWSPENPALYELELFGERFRYGIRTTEFLPTKGFFLNGKHRQMRGVCLHHDLGPIGARFDRTFARRQLSLLKEMGVDAIRTSHNPPAAALLDLCDELGVLVMDEAFDMWEKPKGDYGKFFKTWHDRDLTEMIRRDRSHPSVVMWSVGNELAEFDDPAGTDAKRIASALTAIVKREDATRPVTFGSWKPAPMWNGCQNTVDAFGANYLPFRYAEFTAKNPTVGLVGTETCSTVSSRGEYFFPVVASPIASEADLQRRRNEGREHMVRGGHMSGYDLWGPHLNDYPPDVEFEYQEKNPQVYGEFVWTGFDYIGEPDPCAQQGGRLSYFGIFDLCGFAKDRYWLYKAQWRPDEPSAHILPHWTWPGREGEVTPVHVYSSGDEAELFVNGVSQGRKTRGKYQYRFVWDDVKYQPGEVVVKTWKKGQPWAEDRVVTAGEPVKVIVEEEKDFPAFRRLKVVDAKGNFCPTAKITVKLAELGLTNVLAATGGDPTEHAPVLGVETVKTFNGLALVVVK